MKFANILTFFTHLGIVLRIVFPDLSTASCAISLVPVFSDLLRTKSFIAYGSFIKLWIGVFSKERASLIYFVSNNLLILFALN